MANVTITDLPAASAVTAADVTPLVSGGNTTKATPAQMVTAALNAAPVTVAQGGTGATTAAAAQTALNVPSRTGTGATGTWGISVTGTAQKATDLANGVAGDLPYQSGDTATEFLPIGTAGQVLTVVNGLPAWAASGSLDGVTQTAMPYLTSVGNGASKTATGTYNTFFGKDAGKLVTTGAGNTIVGATAGNAITTGSNNTIVGRYSGSVALSGAVILADGSGNARQYFNNTGAMSFDNGTNFGSTNHILKSNGNGAAPSWGQANKVPTLNISVDTSIPSTSVYAVFFANASARSITVTLPQASGNAGLQFTLKRVDGNTGNTVTVNSLGGNIEGSETQSLGINIAIIYCSDGTNWWELANS